MCKYDEYVSTYKYYIYIINICLPFKTEVKHTGLQQNQQSLKPGFIAKVLTQGFGGGLNLTKEQLSS